MGVFLVLLLAICSPVAALGDPSDPIPGLFSSDVPLKFVLAADFDELDDDRGQESEKRPGRILLRGFDGNEVEVPVQVNTRGMFRLQRRICRDPPLRLDFDEATPLGTVFDGQNKLKLVTHCRDSDSYEQNLIEEYLAYRFYNLLTPISFGVQLAEITYLDTSGKSKPLTRMAFLIEDEDALAIRLGGTMIEAPTTRPDNFVLDQLSLMYLFQYMVGNVDWGTGTSHNVKILLKDREYFPIPYDFDWTGFVDASYAGPNQLTQNLHKSVRERLYWGVCMPQIDYQGLFRRVSKAQEAVLALVRNQKGLSEKNVESALDYLGDFFETIQDPDRADWAIVRACRKWL